MGQRKLLQSDPAIEAVGNVVQPASAVYAAFYASCGQLAAAAYRGSSTLGPIVDGRVLQCDNPFSRSMHLFVGQIGLQVRQRQSRRDEQGNPYHGFTYDNSNFRVITTDGSDIRRWQVGFAYGVHQGRLNGVDKQYDPAKETLHLNLTAEDELTAKLTVTRIGARGTMSFSDGVFAWILDAETSMDERERALHDLD